MACAGMELHVLAEECVGAAHLMVARKQRGRQGGSRGRLPSEGEVLQHASSTSSSFYPSPKECHKLGTKTPVDEHMKDILKQIQWLFQATAEGGPQLQPEATLACICYSRS